MAQVNQSILDGFEVFNQTLNKKDFRKEWFDQAMSNIGLNSMENYRVLELFVEQYCALDELALKRISEKLYPRIEDGTATLFQKIDCGLSSICLCLISVAESNDVSVVDKMMFQNGFDMFEEGAKEFNQYTSTHSLKENFKEGAAKRLRRLLNDCGLMRIDYAKIGVNQRFSVSI